MSVETGNDRVDVFLAHYGVKGMKWGVRRSRRTTSDGRSVATLGERRAMNKAARGRQRADAKKESQDRDADIMRARGERSTARANIKKARKEYKNDRLALGRVTAKELLNDKTKQDWATIERANEMTQREQQINAVIQASLAVAKVAATR